eukprot:TRINITY_DN16706_c0_g1_i1.p1 TRINITY_DN16706_c0_g1~~TRINITY_DN16706_c0_g1_i1.p1  ORF type:complete len:427 (-),score=33.87 TRINITY_DN16706_c0_g1_i1:162-1391(-)
MDLPTQAYKAQFVFYMYAVILIALTCYLFVRSFWSALQAALQWHLYTQPKKLLVLWEPPTWLMALCSVTAALQPCFVFLHRRITGKHANRVTAIVRTCGVFSVIIFDALPLLLRLLKVAVPTWVEFFLVVSPVLVYAIFIGHWNQVDYHPDLTPNPAVDGVNPAFAIQFRSLSHVDVGAPNVVQVPRTFFALNWSWWFGGPSKKLRVTLDPATPSAVGWSAPFHMEIQPPWAKKPLPNPWYCTTCDALFGFDVLDTLLLRCGGVLTVTNGVLEIPDKPNTHLEHKGDKPFFFEALVDDTWQVVDTGSNADCLVVHPSDMQNHGALKWVSGHAYTNGGLKNVYYWITTTSPHTIIFPSPSQTPGETTKILGTASLPESYQLRKAHSSTEHAFASQHPDVVLRAGEREKET